MSARVSNAKWLRVNRQNPCVVCGRFDWDTFCPELNLACCMRVVSERPSKNGGYLHPFNGEFKQEYVKREEPRRPEIDAAGLMEEFARDTDPAALSAFAKYLGVNVESLRLVGCQRAVRRRAWAFPMFNGGGKMIGIRLRYADNSKDCVYGSRNGIFMLNKEPTATAYIVEGASDLAALDTIGLYGIGRPQCLGCISIITAALARLRIRRVVIITDSDNVGLEGTVKLVKELDIPSLIFIPPTKDLREAVRLGLTAPLLESQVHSQPWTIPNRK